MLRIVCDREEAVLKDCCHLHHCSGFQSLGKPCQVKRLQVEDRSKTMNVMSKENTLTLSDIFLAEPRVV